MLPSILIKRSLSNTINSLCKYKMALLYLRVLPEKWQHSLYSIQVKTLKSIKGGV